MSLLRLTVQPRAGVTRYGATETLDRRAWKLTWFTSEIDDAWFLDVTNDAGERLRGVPVSAGLDILMPYRHLDIPQGTLFVLTSTGRDPRVADFLEGNAAAYYLEPPS